MTLAANAASIASPERHAARQLDLLAGLAERIALFVGDARDDLARDGCNWSDAEGLEHVARAIARTFMQLEHPEDSDDADKLAALIAACRDDGAAIVATEGK